MNVFLKELKTRRKSLIIWSVVMIIYLYLSMLKFETFSATPAVVSELLRNFPSTLKAVFGMGGLDLTTLSGYFGVVFAYTALLVAVFAGMLGSRVLSDEESDKTSEFLYAKPIPRSKILTAKLSVVLIDIVILCAVLFAGSLALVSKFSPTSQDIHFIILLNTAALIIMLVFAALGAAASSLLRRAVTGGKIIAMLVFACFVLDSASKLTPDLDWMKYFSIFSWFDAQRILTAMNLNMYALIASSALVVIGIVVTYVFYSKKDLTT